MKCYLLIHFDSNNFHSGNERCAYLCFFECLKTAYIENQVNFNIKNFQNSLNI